MNILLDTHTFLWFVFGNPRLSMAARAIIEEEETNCFLSIASVWEMAIKHSIGKLPLMQPFQQFVPQQLLQNAMHLLPIELSHLHQVSHLPLHHRDPFDRLIIAQSITERMPVVSIDAAFDAYGVTRLW